MLPVTIKDILVSRITRLCGKCTIYLFGSYAYGNPTCSSDVDIAVIMDSVESNITKASELWDALRDVDLPKDIIVASKEEFDFYKIEAGSVFRTIAQKGIILNVA
jgi:predicted nucleotidyltransferase